MPAPRSCAAAAAATWATSSTTARGPTGLRYCINSCSLDLDAEIIRSLHCEAGYPARSRSLLLDGVVTTSRDTRPAAVRSCLWVAHRRAGIPGPQPFAPA